MIQFCKRWVNMSAVEERTRWQPDWNFLPAQLRTHSSARGKNFSLITCHLAQGKIGPRDIQGQVGGACKINVSTQSFIKQDFNSYPLTGSDSRQRQAALSRHLARYQGISVEADWRYQSISVIWSAASLDTRSWQSSLWQSISWSPSLSRKNIL